MARKRHTPEQIIRKLREAEVELAKGLTTADVVRKLEITEQTYYRWRKEYGGLRLDQAQQRRWATESEASSRAAPSMQRFKSDSHQTRTLTS